MLRLLEAHQLDFHSTFRTLSTFQPSTTELELFAARLTPETLVTSKDARERAQKEWVEWLETYKRRIEDERDDWGEHEDWSLKRVQEGQKANPRFVLRQWVLEEVIKKVEEDHVKGKRILAKVLEVCRRFDYCNRSLNQPFRRWFLTHSNLGVVKTYLSRTRSLTRKLEKSGGTAGWDLTNILGSSVAAQAEYCSECY